MVGGVVYYSSLQEIPFTHRRHAILISVEMEKELGKSAFEQVIFFGPPPPPLDLQNGNINMQ